jgi:hypothetical protein
VAKLRIPRASFPRNRRVNTKNKVLKQDMKKNEPSKILPYQTLLFLPLFFLPFVKTLRSSLPSKFANKVLESVWFNGGEKRDFNGWRGGILNCFMFDSKRGWEDF